MDINRHTCKAIIIFIISICLVTGCEKIPTQMITEEPVDKAAVATISKMNDSSLTGTATFMETVQPHFHPPGTPPHSHANTQMNVPAIQPGGGARTGCGLIALKE